MPEPLSEPHRPLDALSRPRGSRLPGEMRGTRRGSCSVSAEARMTPPWVTSLRFRVRCSSPMPADRRMPSRPGARPRRPSAAAAWDGEVDARLRSEPLPALVWTTDRELRFSAGPARPSPPSPAGRAAAGTSLSDYFGTARSRASGDPRPPAGAGRRVGELRAGVGRPPLPVPGRAAARRGRRDRRLPRHRPRRHRAPAGRGGARPREGARPGHPRLDRRRRHPHRRRRAGSTT